MTRRSFLSDMLKCGIATTFLPGAGRIWKPNYEPCAVRFFVPEPKRLDLQALFKTLYDLKHKREAAGKDMIELYIEGRLDPSIRTPDFTAKGVYQQMIEV